MAKSILYSFFFMALAVSWLAPNHYLPWLGFYNESIAVSGLLALSLWLLIQQKGLASNRIQLPLAGSLFLALALVPLIQATFGIILFWGDAWTASLFLAMFGFAITVGYGIAQVESGKLATSLAIILLLSATTSFYLALCQWLGISLGIWLIDAPPGSAAYANIGQRNILATLFCFGLIAALYLREKYVLGNIATTLFTLLLIVGLAITRSRTPFLIMLVFAAWMIIWHQKHLPLKLNKTEIITGTAFFALLWFIWPNIADLLYLSAESSLARIEGAAGGEVRFKLWQQLIEAAWLRPFAGYGWNQVSLAQIEVAADTPPSVAAQFSHNIVIDFMLWNGLLPGLALAALGAWWLLNRIKECRTKEAWFCLGILLALGVHSMLEAPHTYAFFLVPVGLCIGIIEQSHGTLRIYIPRWSYIFAVIVGWGMWGWVSGEYIYAEQDYRLMRFESVKIAPKPETPTTVDLKLLTQLREEILFRRTYPYPDMSAEKIRWMEDTAHRYATPENLSKLALAQGLNGQIDKSARTLQTLENLHGRRNLTHTQRRWLSYACDYPELNNVKVPWNLEIYSPQPGSPSCPGINGARSSGAEQ